MVMKTPLEWVKLYNSDEFKQNNFYDGDLGPSCMVGRSLVRLWSPVADSIKINFYRHGNDKKTYWSADMTSKDHGVWEWSMPENMHGIYYDFTLQIDGESFGSPDPYARACNVNGRRSMFVDLDQTNPEGWNRDTAPDVNKDILIDEIHVKEFSHNPNGGFPEDVRGKYKAFTIPHTTLDGQGKVATGLDFFKSMGVTHLQLMPIYDYGSVDEASPAEQFNWGYDPVNYNVPEGSYATDAEHGDVRIRELKEAIMGIHKAGMRVVMDVVYNHTWNMDHPFQRTVPYYYYRVNDDGSLSNGSGCGNDIASERAMCEKYIIDSIMYWAKEYHIDGFRFDLMGLLTVDLMNKIRQKLDDKYGKGEKLMYGEPWTAGSTHVMADAKLADKGNIGLLDINVGEFNDDTRDSIKGSAGDLKAPGFVNGGHGLENRIIKAAKAWRSENANVKAPSQIINYISAHDNQTLWDKLSETTPYEDLRERQNRLAAALYILAQGHPFALSGESFKRSKGGNPNSHNAPIEINQLDWSLAKNERELVSYYRGLIRLRRQLPGIMDMSPFAYTRIGNEWANEGVVGWMVDNSSDQEPTKYEYLCLIFNASNNAKSVELDTGRWDILATGHDSWLWQNPESVSKKVTVDPVDWIILGENDDHGEDKKKSSEY